MGTKVVPLSLKHTVIVITEGYGHGIPLDINMGDLKRNLK